MIDQKIALVTGANKGIGYEIAAGLGALGYKVGVGARDDVRREAAVEKLRAVGADVFGVPLDVTDDASVTAAAHLVQERAGGLDALVNNAGITGGPEQAPTTVNPATMLAVVQTNVIGVMRVTNAMLPMLRRAASPRIVNVSSSVGSLAHPPDHAGQLRGPGRGGVRALEVVPQRGHGAVRQGAGGHQHPHQRRLPRLRRHRPQRLPRHRHRAAGRGHPDPVGDAAGRRSHGPVLRGRRHRPLVIGSAQG